MGKNNDQAHPPIHPTKSIANAQLGAKEQKVYEFITRRFLACVSKNAKGKGTTVEIDIANERFEANGLVVLEKNYLDVYPYEKWETHTIPKYTVGETFKPSKIGMNEGTTTAPSLLTEPELINLMDKNGIGEFF